jgi:hypothetical protein
MTITLIELGVIISMVTGIIALILASVALARVRQQLHEANKLSQRIARDLALANSGSVGMGRRLLAMEKRLQEEPANNAQIDYQNDAEFQPYAQAAQLFQLGLDCEEVARRCGLSRAEASLMEMMQKANR